MSDFSFTPGWHCDPEAVSQSVERMEKAGSQPVFGAARPDLKGHFKRLNQRGIFGVFLFAAEEALFGEYLPADFQRAGTCVSRGTYRACQTSYLWGIIHSGDLAAPKILAYEPIYGGSRIDIGGGRLGRGDGSVGGWGAEYVSRFGVTPREKYGRYDLLESNESLAVEWGMPGVGVPTEIKAASHRVGACHISRDAWDWADQIAAGYALAFCSGTLWGDRGSNGISRPSGNGAHCECMTGVCVDDRGELIFIRQQSWGDNNPGGPRTLEFADGGSIDLPAGAYGAYGDDVQRAHDRGRGECWAFGDILPWRPETTADFLSESQARRRNVG